VGDLIIDDRGLAARGLLVRHLVLPNGLAGTAGIFQFLTNEISPNTYLNIMTQYRPAFNADQFPKLNRPPTQREFQDAFEAARAAGLHRLDERASTI
jgi:putative pyruvate formate lyase activating enzyme